jgi:hypothetical protein
MNFSFKIKKTSKEKIHYLIYCTPKLLLFIKEVAVSVSSYSKNWLNLVYNTKVKKKTRSLKSLLPVCLTLRPDTPEISVFIIFFPTDLV